MEKTYIEKLASEYATNEGNYYEINKGLETVNDIRYVKKAFENGYKTGSSEQKAIDDKELATYVDMTAKEAKKVIIDKACEWLAVSGVFNGNTCGDLKRYIENFREAMED